MLALLAVSGCKSLSYYGQAAKGQLHLLSAARPIEKVLADPASTDELKDRLRCVLELRRFAESELALPVNGHYQKYADLHRPFVVWNIQAAPKYSLEPKQWWYPLVGNLDYRGYFNEGMARDYAQTLRAQDYDVHLGGVTAYSTLGWFKDPVLNTFLADPKPDLAETLFHELAHQQVFAHGDTHFNEAFATMVGQEGTRRWLRSRGDARAYQDYLAQLKRNRQFVALVMNTRAQLEKLYGDYRDPDGKIRAAETPPTFAPGQLESEKRRLLAELTAGYETLKKSWNGASEYDGWFREINNAKLNSVAAYYDLVPGFERLLEIQHGLLPDFYRAAERLAKKDRQERHQWLRNMAPNAASARDLAAAAP